MKNYSDFGIDIPYSRTSGQIKAICPHCHEQRRDKRDKSLSVNLDKGVWNCHYCGWHGTVNVGKRTNYLPKRTYTRPVPVKFSAFTPKCLKWFSDRGISDATLNKMKVSEGNHFMPQLGKEVNTIQFNYYLDGELINVKYRTGDKQFAMAKNAELIPYNIDAITGQEECIITEGEMDCLSFIEVGMPNCISVPNGASNNLSYLDEFIDGWFFDKTTIYIAVDTDTKGVELRNELIRRFGADVCKLVTFGDGCKDANEHLVKYGVESLKECIAKAKEIREEGVFTVSDFEDDLDALFDEGMPEGETIGLGTFDKLCNFETGRLAIVTGVPGSGKSEFLDEVTTRMALKHNWRCAYFSPENEPRTYHVSKLISKLTGAEFKPSSLSRADYEEAKDYVNSNFFFISPNGNFDVDTILAKAKFLVRRFGIKTLVIDPFNRLDIAGSNSKETDVIRDILRKLTVFAQQNNVLVFLVAHPTKMSRKESGEANVPNLYDISGSAHFYNMADYGLVVNRNRVHDYVEVRVEKVRFKHNGSVGAARMSYNNINGRYVPYIEGMYPNWDNTNHLKTNSVADIFAA